MTSSIAMNQDAEVCRGKGKDQVLI